MVDDNKGIRDTLKILLGGVFESVELLPSPVNLIHTIDTFRPDLVLLDMNFTTDTNTGGEGLFWTGEIKSRFPEMPVVLFTAYADIALAVEGMKRGAADFIVKPWDNAKLIEVLSTIRDLRKPSPRSKAAHIGETGMYWGSSPAITALKRNMEKIASTDASVLITGENGTGKDELARELHRISRRAGKVMVCVDAGAITETLFESELFGHVKGAFTDARSDHPGKFEQADGGTLFLDEIANIPIQSQAKLLRVLQNRSVTRVGDTKSIPVDIRLICATNADVPALVRNGKFREDLYYRLNTISLELPPLRERRDEIIPLAERFMKEFAEKYRRAVSSFSPKAIDELTGYPWPGNIRELRNCVEKAVILSEGEAITTFSLEPVHVQKADYENDPTTIADAEEGAIRTAMSRYGGNISLVAKSLGVSRPTLYAKLKKYGI